MMFPLHQRRSGVLLHLTSLPGPFAQGVCGQEALGFIDRLADAGFRCWQFLPLGPTHGHGSPYESLSSFAGNPELIDLRLLHAQGWLNDEQLQSVLQHSSTAAQARAMSAAYFKAQVLPTAHDIRKQWDDFCSQEADWLRPYSCFMAFKQAAEDQPWWQWSTDWKRGDEQSLLLAESLFAEAVQLFRFEQFVFAQQWQRIHQYAEQRGVALFGDLPIYVAHDSADVWSNQYGFTLDSEGRCTQVAGVPPDYFSADGQRWGNPLYRWDVMQDDDFSWWRKRVHHQLKRMHWMRIDHFLGLHHYWAIPAEYDHGRIGEWLPAPGEALLQRLTQDLGELPLIAEDLGLVTPEVTALREQFSLPGMKVLQFAFGGGSDNPFLPHQHEVNSVAYTGTHDNDTTLGWFRSTDDRTKQYVCDYLGCDANAMPWPIIRAALASVSTLAIIPMQDLLAFSSDARFNTPGTLQGNWCWRLAELGEADWPCWASPAAFNKLYQR